MKLLENKDNKLLNRKEVFLQVEGDSNPGYDSCTKMVASETKAKEGTVVIKRIRSKFGSGEFVIEAYVYDSPEDLARIEPRAKVKKEAV